MCESSEDPDDDEHHDDERDHHRPDVDLSHGCRPRKFAKFATLRARTRCLTELSVYRAFDLGDPEWLACDFRQRLRIDQELVAKDGLELAHVHLGHQDMIEALQ